MPEDEGSVDCIKMFPILILLMFGSCTIILLSKEVDFWLEVYYSKRMSEWKCVG